MELRPRKMTLWICTISVAISWNIVGLCLSVFQSKRVISPITLYLSPFWQETRRSAQDWKRMVGKDAACLIHHVSKGSYGWIGEIILPDQSRTSRAVVVARDATTIMRF